MTHGYAYDHAWTLERVRLAGLEGALDPGTREHLTRLGVGPGTRCLESQAQGYPALEVLRHDITAEALPTGFDIVHTRWLVEWLPDKRSVLRRLVSALRPGGVLLIEEPDFVTMYESGDSLAVRHVYVAAMRHLESTCPVECEYGRRAMGDLLAVGLEDVQAEGRCPIVR